MNKLLSYYTSLFGTSGHEGDVRRGILNEISEYADTRVDNLGNLIAFKRGKYPAPATFMLCAHMDEVGLMVSHITDDGCLKFVTIGGIDARTLVGKQVAVGRKKIPGVIGRKAPHLEKEESRKKALEIDDLYIDIGAKDKSDASVYVSEGDVIGFRSDYAEFGSGLVRAKALDDRIGCQVLTELIKEELPFDTYFVFTVMEEIGCVGASAAAFGIKPDYAIAIEGTTAADFFDDGNKTPVCSVGKGPVISFMDGGTIYNKDFYKLALASAKDGGIPYQLKQAVAGGNDSYAIQRTASGCACLTLSVAVRYLHTPMAVASLDDIEKTKQLLLAILNNF